MPAGRGGVLLGIMVGKGPSTKRVGENFNRCVRVIARDDLNDESIPRATYTQHLQEIGLNREARGLAASAEKELVLLAAGSMSPEHAHDVMKRALFLALFPQPDDVETDPESTRFAARIEKATSTLLASIDPNPPTWTCAVPVGGMTDEGLPISFAGVTFRPAPATDHPERHRLTFDFGNMERHAARLGDKVVGVVDVRAGDGRAAAIGATARVATAADGLTLVGMCFGAWSPAVRVAPEMELAVEVVVSEALERGDGHISGRSEGSYPLRPKDLLGERAASVKQALEAAIDAEPTNDLLWRIHAATQLCAKSGRASRPAEALFWAIMAVEAATRGRVGRPSKERTAERFAVFLDEPTRRDILVRRYKQLHKLRNRVAHGYGSESHITDFDVKDAQNAAKRTLVALLMNDPWRGCSDRADFRRHLEAAGAEAIGKEDEDEPGDADAEDFNE